MYFTIYHLGALFFGLVAIHNIYSARKYGESYMPAIAASMMSVSFSLLLVLPLQYGSAVFLLTTIFALVNYKKTHRLNREKMKRYIADSQGTEKLKLADYFTGWKLLHRLNRKYGPVKASLINSFFMWFFGILLFAVFTYLWPEIFSDFLHMAFIMTIVVTVFYWQNKKLLESLGTSDLRQMRKE